MGSPLYPAYARLERGQFIGLPIGLPISLPIFIHNRLGLRCFVGVLLRFRHCI